MKVLNYSDFISEGMWAKGFERARTGERRKENFLALDVICDMIPKILKDKLGIDGSPNSCRYKEIKVPNSYKSFKYQIDCDFTEWFGEKYPMFTFDILVKKDIDKQDIYGYLHEFVYGFMNHLDTYYKYNYVVILKNKNISDDDIIKFQNKYMLPITNVLVRLSQKGYKNNKHLELTDLYNFD